MLSRRWRSMRDRAVDLRRSLTGCCCGQGVARPRRSQRRALSLCQPDGQSAQGLWWDRTGYCVLCKRLERGVFRLPSAMRPGDASVAIEASEFAKILEGLDFRARRRR